MKLTIVYWRNDKKHVASWNVDVNDFNPEGLNSPIPVNDRQEIADSVDRFTRHMHYIMPNNISDIQIEFEESELDTQ